jgi:hypothetical protein
LFCEKLHDHFWESAGSAAGEYRLFFASVEDFYALAPTDGTSFFIFDASTGAPWENDL